MVSASSVRFESGRDQENNARKYWNRVITLDIILGTMKTKITPLLSHYEETPLRSHKGLSVILEDEVTFMGAVYKSVLLDLNSDRRNLLTSCTKVRDETTDDE